MAISAVQGAFTDAGSVPEWGQSNVASVSIFQVTPGELVAPVGIWFEATNISGFSVDEPAQGEVYDETAHAITWIWDFDDLGTFETSLNMPQDWKNKSAGYGKKAYHVFDTPGIYNVRVWGVDRNGVTGEQIVPVEVLDPNAVYPSIRTICVSNQGNFTGAPSGANLVTSLGAARSAANSLGQTGRILLRAGETFQEKMDIDDPMRNCRIGSFGAGPKPVLTPPPPASSDNTANIFVFRNGNQVADSAFYGLRFQGEWDAATETGDPRGRGIFYSTHNGIDFTSLVYQCEFDGMGAQLFSPPTSTRDHTIGCVDCDVTNWQDYGVWFGSGLPNYRENTRFALVGCAVHQKQNACRGGQGKIGLSNAHGPFRHVDTMQGVIASCDFYSANSWVSGVQPCLRIAQADSSNPGGYFVNINRIVCEGGAIGGIDGQNGNTTELPGNHVIDKFLFISDYSSFGGFSCAFGGTTLRNGMIVRLSMNYQSATPLTFLNFGLDGTDAGNRNTPVDIHNVTFLNLHNEQVSEPLRQIDNFLNATVENNIYHEPNIPSPNTADGPLDLSTDIPGVTPRNLGERASVEKVQVTDVSVSSGGTVTVPYPVGTSASDFSTAGRHTVLVGGNYYFSYRSECSLSFGGSSITVTNTSGDGWSGDLRLGLEQETLSTNSSLASPSNVPMPIPQTGSSALNNSGGYQSYTNFLTAQRAGPWKGAL